MNALVLLAILSGVAQGQEAVEPPVPVVVPTPPPLHEAETCVLRPLGGAEAGTRAALRVRSIRVDDGLVVQWLPSGAERVVVHVASTGLARPTHELVCAVADDGTLVLDAAGLAALGGAGDLGVAVLQQGGRALAGALPWVASTTPPLRAVRVPKIGAVPDPTLRRHLRAARGYQAVGGLGAGWGTGVGLVAMSLGSLAPEVSELSVAPASLGLETFLIGTDVSLHRAHDRLEALGRATSRRRLRVAEGLQYGGLALQVTGTIVASLTTWKGEDVPAFEASAATQFVGAALQLGAVAAYELDARHVRTLAATLQPTADGASLGVQGTF